jgi:hypothetical protein
MELRTFWLNLHLIGFIFILLNCLCLIGQVKGDACVVTSVSDTSQVYDLTALTKANGYYEFLVPLITFPFPQSWVSAMQAMNINTNFIPGSYQNATNPNG